MCCFTGSSIAVRHPWSKLGLSSLLKGTSTDVSPYRFRHSSQWPFSYWPNALTARIPASSCTLLTCSKERCKTNRIDLIFKQHMQGRNEVEQFWRFRRKTTCIGNWNDFYEIQRFYRFSLGWQFIHLVAAFPHTHMFLHPVHSSVSDRPKRERESPKWHPIPYIVTYYSLK